MATAAELNEATANLAKATANIDRHIAAEALKRANKLAVQYAKAADERIEQNAADLQRATDCIAEMRRQMAHLDRIAAQHKDLVRRINELAGQAHKLGEGVPGAVLHAAVTNARNAGCAASTKET
jgi:ABC-type transporter Mla subunit MlaD